MTVFGVILFFGALLAAGALAVGFILRRRCGLCGYFRRGPFSAWEVNGRRRRVCPACHRRLEERKYAAFQRQ